MMISNRKRPRFSPMLLGFLVLSIFLLTLGYFFGNTLRSGASLVFSPILRGEQALAGAVLGSFEQLTTRKRLIEENRQLKEALARGEMLVLDRNRLFEENLELKERLGRNADPDAITAVVLLSPPSSPYDTLLLDVGAGDRVEVGDKIAAGGAVLIGEVSEVYPDSSRGILYSAAGEEHEGFISPANIPVTAQGLGGGALRGTIPPGAEVQKGDELSFPSISANIAAFVEYVEYKEGDSYQSVYFRMPVNPAMLRHVDIWRASR